MKKATKRFKGLFIDFLPFVLLLLQCLEWNGWTWVRAANGRKTQRFVRRDTTRLLWIHCVYSGEPRDSDEGKPRDLTRGKSFCIWYRKTQRFGEIKTADKTEPFCYLFYRNLNIEEKLTFCLVYNWNQRGCL